MFFETVDKIFAPLILALYFASSLDNLDNDPVKTMLLLEKKLIIDQVIHRGSIKIQKKF